MVLQSLIKEPKLNLIQKPVQKDNKKKPLSLDLIVSSCICVGGALADVVATSCGIKNSGLEYEFNPFAKFVYEIAGASGLYAMKIGAYSLFNGVCAYFHQKFAKSEDLSGRMLCDATLSISGLAGIYCAYGWLS